jgi:hypothetical protein
MSEYAALIGIDWADSKHDLCLIDPQTLRREASQLHHSPKTIDEWANALRARFGGHQIAVCLEQSRGRKRSRVPCAPTTASRLMLVAIAEGVVIVVERIALL